MARRRRGVRVLKWLDAGLCGLIAAAFVVSLWWQFGYQRFSGRSEECVAVTRGGFSLVRYDVMSLTVTSS